MRTVFALFDFTISVMPVDYAHFIGYMPPFFRTPLTDLTSTLIDHQQYHKCGTFEMDMMECLEAYGYDKGLTKCKDLCDDFKECLYMKKQMLRIEAMQKERARQYRAGERKVQYSPPPKEDAY